MSTAGSNLNSSNGLLLRRRPDLEIYPQRRRTQPVWVIKDPLSLRYFQFRREEYEILRWLDGRSSLEQIKERFERRFAPRRMSIARLHQFIGNLHRSGLVIGDVSGQGETLLRRHDQQRRNTLLAGIANPLAIRFRGVNPTAFLDRLYPSIRWLFTPTSVMIAVAVVAMALMMLVNQFDTFLRRLPELNSLLSPSNLIWLAVAMAFVKLIHELGHAMVCNHYGGRCHEIGIMLLVGTPCLYCNVTDAWKLANRWHRMAISAAGIAVEVVLAAIATILWLSSQPGFFNTLCLNVMVVCSVGTVLLNGNPLLRYDGYYILSDWLEHPNLWQDARGCLHRLLSRVFLGLDPGVPVTDQGRPVWLLLYATASMIYRSFVIVSILYLLYRILKPEGLLVLTYGLTALMLAGIMTAPISSFRRLLSNPGARHQLKPQRLLISVAAVATILAACFLIPLPVRIEAPAMVEARGARRVYVSVPGRLKESVQSGAVVLAGQTLGKLENVEITRQLLSVQGQMLRQRQRVESLEAMRADDLGIASQLPAAKEFLSDLERRFSQLQKDQQALLLTAPITGTVLPPPSLPAKPSDEASLASWNGIPMDPINQGVTLERNTLYCLIGPNDEFEAAVFVDLADVELIQPGHRVRLMFDIASGQVITGTIAEISQVNLESVPAELALNQQVSNRVDERGVARPEHALYKTLVRLDPTDAPLMIGARGHAKIAIDPQPFSKILHRFWSRTFKTVI